MYVLDERAAPPSLEGVVLRGGWSVGPEVQSPLASQRSAQGSPHACPCGSGRPLLPHRVGVGWCRTNGVRQLCHQQVRTRWSPENVPEGSCLSGSCCGVSGWFSVTSGLGAFHTVGSLLGLRVSGLHCFKSRFSVPYSSVVPWTYSWLLILESSHLGGCFFFLLVWDQMCDIVLSLLKGEFCILSIPSLPWGTIPLGVPRWDSVSASYWSWCISIFGYEATVYVVLGSFSEERYSICSCQFVVSIEGGKFRLFLCCRLKLLISMIHFIKDLVFLWIPFFLNYKLLQASNYVLFFCVSLLYLYLLGA